MVAFQANTHEDEPNAFLFGEYDLQLTYASFSTPSFSKLVETRTAHSTPSQQLLEQKLQSSENRFRSMISNHADGILILDREGKVQYANLAAAALFQSRRMDLQDRSLFDELVVENADYDMQTDVIQNAEELDQEKLTVVQTQVEILHRDGQITIAEMRMVDTEWEGKWACLATLRDVTAWHRAKQALQRSESELRQKAEALEVALQELQQTQAQLVHSEKMSGLSQMVAGISHEINNPLNFIQGNLPHINQYVQELFNLFKLYQVQYPAPTLEIQTALTELDLEFVECDLTKILTSMFIGTDRIRQIVQSLRSFSRLDEAEKKPVDIHEGIDSTLLILESRLQAQTDRPAIQVTRQYEGLPKVVCYAGQLNQVFFNLLVNAIDALEERFCHARKLQQDSPNPTFPVNSLSIKIQTEVKGERIGIRIADNGIGIPEEIKSRLFDPFFTTKPVGQGTGMGLSISHQIIQKHQGTIQCISEPGSGTEFYIELPQLDYSD